MKTIKFHIGAYLDNYLWFLDRLFALLGAMQPIHDVKFYLSLLKEGQKITLNPFEFYYKDGYLYVNNKNDHSSQTLELLEKVSQVAREELSSYDDYLLSQYETEFL